MRRGRGWSNAVKRSANRHLLPREPLSPGVVCQLLSGGPEAGPSLVGHGGDPFGSQHPREGAKHAGEPPGRHDGHALGDDLAPGDLGAVDGHDRHHRHARVGQDPGGLVGFEVHRLQGGGQG